MFEDGMIMLKCAPCCYSAPNTVFVMCIEVQVRVQVLVEGVLGWITLYRAYAE